MGDNLPAIDLGTGAKAAAISAGGELTCALLQGGSVKCWGANNTGGLGLGLSDHGPLGDEPNQMGDNLPAVSLGTGKTVLRIDLGGAHECALLNDSTIKCWGYNDYGQLGQGHDGDRGDYAGHMGDNLPAVDLGAGKTAAAITAGGLHTCALLDDDTIKCWGDNGEMVGTLEGSHNALGLGDTANRGDDANEMGDDLPVVDL